MLVFILIISILIYIVFKIIRTALNYLHTINSYQNFINKKNEWLNQHNKTKNALIFIKNGIIFMYLGLNKLIYIILVVASLLTQAMHFYLAKEQILKFDLTSQQAIQFLVGPIVIWVFLIAIMYLYLKEIGELKKVYYTVKFISETNVKNEELIHLHTRSTKEWVLVRVNDLQEQNTIFLYNPETKNWLEYNKVIHD
ncbi:hypothetical protein CN474_21495 [Bacillus thuringiensis]|nr:hypothetical protein CN474_21495 [Bacillus thuringiensis]